MRAERDKGLGGDYRKLCRLVQGVSPELKGDRPLAEDIQRASQSYCNPKPPSSNAQSVKPIETDVVIIGAGGGRGRGSEFASRWVSLSCGRKAKVPPFRHR